MKYAFFPPILMYWNSILLPFTLILPLDPFQKGHDVFHMCCWQNTVPLPQLRGDRNGRHKVVFASAFHWLADVVE